MERHIVDHNSYPSALVCDFRESPPGKVFWTKIKENHFFVVQTHKSESRPTLVFGAVVKSIRSVYSNGAKCRILLKSEPVHYEVATSESESEILEALSWLEDKIYPFFLEWDQYIARKSSNDENYYKKLQSPDELKFKWLIDFFSERRFTIPPELWLIYEPGVGKNGSYVVVPRQQISNVQSPKQETVVEKPKVEDDDENCCKICFEEEIQVALVPCGHTCLCTGCSVNLKKCPICRNDVKSVLKLYKS